MLTLNKFKKIIILSLAILLALSSNVIGIVKPTSNFYVNDYAGVLSLKTENYIMQANVDLEQKTGAQIVVVIVNSLDGKTIEEYATELFRNFGIGDKNKNNGVLLLCSTGDRMFRIEVGYGLEGRLTDGKTGRIQDEYIIPYLRNNNYDEGIKNGFSAVLQEVATEYGVTINGAQQVKKNSYSDIDMVLSRVYNFTMISSAITLILKSITIFKKLKHTSLFIIIYMFILAIISYLYIKNITFVMLTIVANLAILLVLAMKSGGGYWRSGGGFSGGGRWLLRRWRLFRRRRKFKKLLKNISKFKLHFKILNKTLNILMCNFYKRKLSVYCNILKKLI